MLGGNYSGDQGWGCIGVWWGKPQEAMLEVCGLLGLLVFLCTVQTLIIHHLTDSEAPAEATCSS